MFSRHSLSVWLLFILGSWPINVSAEKIAVSEEDGLYTITGQFSVSVSSDVAWQVITDYSRVNLVASAVKTDRIERLSSGRVLLHQTLTTKRDGEKSLIMEAYEDSVLRTISIRDTLSEDFQGYEGKFRVMTDGDRSVIQYTFMARPRFDRWMWPNLVRKKLVRYKMNGIIEKLQKEIEGRTELDIRLVPDANALERK